MPYDENEYEKEKRRIEYFKHHSMVMTQMEPPKKPVGLLEIRLEVDEQFRRRSTRG